MARRGVEVVYRGRVDQWTVVEGSRPSLFYRSETNTAEGVGWGWRPLTPFPSLIGPIATSGDRAGIIPSGIVAVGLRLADRSCQLPASGREGRGREGELDAWHKRCSAGPLAAPRAVPSDPYSLWKDVAIIENRT